MINNKKYITFRADADSKIGIGHFMRCFAIAQAWRKEKGNVLFITNCKNESLLKCLKNEDIEIYLVDHSYPDPKDWEYTKNILSVHENSWFVLDGYHFDENYINPYWGKEGKDIVLTAKINDDDIAILETISASVINNLGEPDEEGEIVLKEGNSVIITNICVESKDLSKCEKEWKNINLKAII